MEPASPHIRVACYARTASLMAPVDTTLRSLERLEADGVIDDLTIGAWPAEVRLCDGPPHSDVVARFEEFDAWATRWNVSICPPFAVETRTSEITGDTHEVLITPVQCLAVYVNGVLLEVFPHSTDRTGDGDTYTVRDALTLLEEHDIRAFGPGHAPATPPSQRTPTGEASLAPDMCPRCQTDFVTGQGIYACPDCHWVGTATGPHQYRQLTRRAIIDRSSAPTPNEDTPATSQACIEGTPVGE